jgi:dTDP-glucose 4,6-dehydratase
METFCVIGANSFSGSGFVAKLLREGLTVFGISRSAEPHPALLPHRWEKNVANYQFHQMDLNGNGDAIADLIQKRRPDYVVNFAAQSMVAQSWAYPEHWFQTNVVATVKLHNKLREFDFLKKYVHVSTPEVYGSTQGLVGEDTAFHPSTPYAVSRAAADMSLQTFFSAYKFPVVFTRAANVYGPGQQLYRIIPRTILFLRLGRPLKLDGGGVSERFFIHVDDVADATLRVARQGTPPEAYHISPQGSTITIRALVERICKKLGKNFDQCVEVGPERLGKDAAYSLDSSRIRKELGWQDRITLDAGIDATCEWVDRYLDTLKEQPFDYLHKA